MTPAQLDKLRRIDAHLANLLSTAEKRTPGEFYHREFRAHDQNSRQVATAMSLDFSNDQCVHNAAFIAAAAGNAEAGWRATRSLIDYLLMMHKHGDGYRYVGLTEDLLAAFPNV